MKKLLGILLFLFVLVLGWSTFILPSMETVATDVTMNAPVARVYALLANQNEWRKWWPVLSSGQADSMEYKGNHYKVSVEGVNTIETIIQQNDSAIAGRIFLLMKSIDTCTLEWSIQVNKGSSPFKKIQHYFTAYNYKADMTAILNRLKKFVEKQENIYGMTIENAQVTDTLLVATKRIFSHYPSTQEIYGMIEKLKTYINSENARATNSPMLNILQTDSGRYHVMVAIPTNKLLSGKEDIEFKRMIPGKIIWGEVKGGVLTVEKAFQQLENYRNDYRLTSPAIPFALLVTDRNKEPDSTKWITRVYYPVF